MTAPSELFAYTITEVARRLSVSRATAYNWAKRGVFPTIESGDRVVCERAAFDSWLNQHVVIRTSTGALVVPREKTIPA